jgi:A/G-specific adenine glycosylase
VLGFAGDMSSSRQERALWDIATDLLPAPSRPGDMPPYTQGVMDLGATVCLPRKPSCMICPVNATCAARLEGAPEKYPVKTRRLHRTAQSAWMLHATDAQGRVWLEKRPVPGIWAGLYALPMFDSREALVAMLPAELRETAADGPAFTHVLTHKDLHLHPVRVRLRDGLVPRDKGGWFAPGQWTTLGLPTPVRRLLEEGA